MILLFGIGFVYETKPAASKLEREETTKKGIRMMLDVPRSDDASTDLM